MNHLHVCILLSAFAVVVARAEGTNTPTTAIVTNTALPSTATSNALPTTITIGGTTYEDVRWNRVTPTTVTIFHKTGVATIPLEKLPPDLQRHFGYDAAKVVKYRERIVEEKRRQSSAGLISVVDDKFGGTRTYKTASEIKLRNSLPVDLRLDVAAYSPDSGRTPPDRVNLHFISSSSDWKFLKFHPLSFLVDGERLSWKEDEVSHNGDVGDSYVLEQMHVNLLPSQFKRLAFAKTVEGKLGISEFTIPYDKRESFRMLSDYLENLKGMAATPAPGATDASIQPQ